MNAYQTSFRARIAVCSLALIASLFVVGGTASAQAEYTSAVTVTISSTPAPGDTFTISGTAAGDSAVVVFVDGAELASFTVASGAGAVPYSFNVTLPTDLAVGTHLLQVTVGGVAASSSNFTIASAQNTADDDQLASTGTESAPLTLVALGLLGVGASLLIVRRRSLAEQ